MIKIMWTNFRIIFQKNSCSKAFELKSYFRCNKEAQYLNVMNLLMMRLRYYETGAAVMAAPIHINRLL